MSSRELIDSLRVACKEKIRLIQQEAEQEAKALRATVAEKIDGLRKHYTDKLVSSEIDESQRALAEASSRARTLRLDAEKAIAERLFSIARSSLPLLRDNNYPMVFEKLVLELPSFPWRLVHVNPADVELARKYFPDAEVVPMESISGGVDATVADGTVRIINTFEKRLERSWGEMIPLLVKDVHQEVSDGNSVQPR